METNVIGLIKSILNTLPNAEKKIAEVILKNPEAVVDLSAKELGEKAGTSAPSVIRLCKRLDIEGYSQLKMMISTELSHSNSGYSDISEGETFYEIKDKLMGNAYQGLLDTFLLIKEEQIKQAVEMIEEADIVFVYGVGASFLVAQNFVQKWRRIGKNCYIGSDLHLFITTMTAMEGKKAFIGISNSGETTSVIKLMKIANDIGCKTVSITQFGKNSVSNHASLSLNHVRSNEKHIRSSATSSLHVQFYVVDILFNYFVAQNYKDVYDKILFSREEISKFNVD